MVQLKKKLVGPFHKRMLYITAGLLWISGILWLYLRYVARSHDELGLTTHPLQTLSLKIHGAAAVGFLIVFGALLYHISPGWRQKYQRPSGLSLIGSSLILILTGWGLYYLGNEYARNFTSIIHSVLGCLLPLIIFYHVLSALTHQKS